jgi:chitodextrinase
MAPASDGGSAVTSFTVTSAPGAKTCTSSGTSCVVSGLENGTSYTFTVTATNTAGTSVASAASAGVTPTAPAPPAPAPAPPAPAPAPPAAPSAAVKVRAASGASKLSVDVNPNKGRGYWTFKVQRQNPNGSWKSLKSYKNHGSRETRSINLPKGTYRVVVRAKYGYAETPSAPVHLKR